MHYKPQLENNVQAYRKYYRSKMRDQACSKCPINAGENSKRKNQWQHKHLSWKLLRKDQVKLSKPLIYKVKRHNSYKQI